MGREMNRALLFQQITGGHITLISDTVPLLRKPVDKTKPKEMRIHPTRGGTTLKGRIHQQFIEVGPIETDERFVIKMIVTLLPE